MTYRTHESPDEEYRSEAWWRYYINHWHQMQRHAAAEGLEL